LSVYSRTSSDPDDDEGDDGRPLPDRDAYKLEPVRHFDADPHWIPDPSDRHSLRHAEFGFCDSQNYRYVSRWNGSTLKPSGAEPAYWSVLTTYLSYLILIGALPG
jgi:hypothetical protein